MADTLTVQHGHVTLTTEEGTTLQQPEAELEEMFRTRYVPPLEGRALPDGVKFVDWREPRLVVVHQSPPALRRLKWIAADSPADYGPGTLYRHVELSLPYAVTFAVFELCGERLRLGRANELYFTNQPIQSRNDRLGFPALLNISKVRRGSRTAPWICTAHLKLKPHMTWTEQLEALVRHTLEGGFNRSSEHHEGASFYGESKSIPGLHPVEEWHRRSQADPAFGLDVPWLPAPVCVGELVDILLQPPGGGTADAVPPPGDFSVIPRFLNFIQSRRPAQ
jgi:hypothetical protein